MPDKGNFITEYGNNKNGYNKDASEHKMDKESKQFELKIDGALIRKINIKSGGFYLHKMDVEPDEFYIILSNNTTIKVDGDNHKTLLLPDRYLIICEKNKTSYRFFINYVDDNEAIYFLRLNKTRYKLFTDLIAFNAELYADLNITDILFNMFNCNYKAELKANYLEAKTMELLCALEYQIKNLETNSDTVEVPEQMNQAIHLAREIMIEDLKTPISLISLARKIGTNENYLKKYFKIVFGQTVFSFLNEYKMKTAKRMLLKDKMQISQVAADLGYKNSSNFSANFFKYYGFLPKKLKSAKLYLLLFIEELIAVFQNIIAV